MKITTQVEGLSAAIAKLKSFGGKLQGRSIRKALTAAAKPVISAAKSEAPQGETGTLKKSQVAKIKSYRRGAYLVAVVGAKNRKYANNKNPVEYSHIVHDGHKGKARRNPYLKRSSSRSLSAAQRIFTWTMTAEIYAAANKKGISL